MELIAPGDRVRTVGGRLNGSQNGLSVLGPVGFANTFSLLITLRVQPKVSVLSYLFVYKPVKTNAYNINMYIYLFTRKFYLKNTITHLYNNKTSTRNSKFKFR